MNEFVKSDSLHAKVNSKFLKFSEKTEKNNASREHETKSFIIFSDLDFNLRYRKLSVLHG
jgi:hypothetical protein